MCVCVDDKKMREDRHNSCIMFVTSEPFMIYLCILFVTGVEMFLLTERNVSLGGMQDGCMDTSNTNSKINELIYSSVTDSGSWSVI